MQNNVKVLLAIMLVLLVTSIFVLRNKPLTSDQNMEMLIPELQDLINQVDGIVIKKNDETITLDRKNNIWRLGEQDGFMADTNTVASLLLDLRKLKLKQRKTSNPDNYAKLALADTGENAATVIVLKSQNQTIADVSIGKRAPKSQGTYVRKNNEAQSWLSEGEINIKTNVSGWILNTILDIEPGLIKSVSFKPNDSDHFVINKLTPEDANFVLADIPQSMQITSQTTIDAVAGGLQQLTIESAKKRASQINESDKVSTVIYQLFSGTTFQLDLIQQADEKIINITVGNNGNDSMIEEEFQDWSFIVPSYKFDALNKRLLDLVEKKVQEPIEETEK